MKHGCIPQIEFLWFRLGALLIHEGTSKFVMGTLQRAQKQKDRPPCQLLLLWVILRPGMKMVLSSIQ